MKKIARVQYILSVTEKISEKDCREAVSCQLEMLQQAGADWIQFRIKDYELAHKILEWAIPEAQDCNLTVIVNDHYELAKLYAADGVHLGLKDERPEIVRSFLGEQFIVGATVNCMEDLTKLSWESIDYIGLGPLRFTQTKKNLSPILGLTEMKKLIKDIRLKSRVPVIAVGGVQDTDIPELLNIGASGLAVSSFVAEAKDPARQMKNLICSVSKCISNRPPANAGVSGCEEQLFSEI